MAAVKLVLNLVNDQSYMQGGLTLLNTFHKINQFVDMNKGQSTRIIKFEDGSSKDDIIYKEQL